MERLNLGSGRLTISGGDVTFRVRSSLSMQFLMAGAAQARAAAMQELKHPDAISEDDKIEHKGLVVGAILQSCAALECEVYEVTAYGPGHHLGSAGIDVAANEFIAPLAEMIDRETVLERYAVVLHLLKKPPLDRGSGAWQEASLAVRLRNELVHYKSRWGDELDRSKLIQALQHKKHRKPSYLRGNANFFPHECLSADCASWSVTSCVRFLDAFYTSIGLPDRLAPYRQRLVSDSA